MLLELTIIHLTKVFYKVINKIVDNLFSSLCFVSPDVLEPYVLYKPYPLVLKLSFADVACANGSVLLIKLIFRFK